GGDFHGRHREMTRSAQPIQRRNFIRDSAAVTGLLAGRPLGKAGHARSSPNETITVAVMGIRNQGAVHLKNYVKLPNVRVAAICDIDERLFSKAVAQVEEATGNPPRTETDIRRVLDDRNIDAISIAAPNHWHALATIWACQAGKDVYVEKPASYSIVEGRRMIEAAAKYRRIVQVGTHQRSRPLMLSAVDYLHSGKLGKIYMIRCPFFRFREDIGLKPDSPAPSGVHYDLWLGPAADRPFNAGRFHYNWHWFWDTGNGETGNNGVHMTDLARHILKKMEHPRRIVSLGGLDVRPGTQETPNTQFSLMEYADGTRVQLEVRGLYSNSEDGMTMGWLVYGSEGWMRIGFEGWATFFGRKNRPGESCQEAEVNARSEEYQSFGSDEPLHYANFIACMRSRRFEDLRTNITEGHLSAAMCHLGNIAYRTGRTLTFDSATERCVGDEQANQFLTRRYRFPFVVPEKV
ncbi:MAG: Gfo/Idh/MocA family oxidoreductase, partial [Acidobacteria bacterium]|nr:Gfo/Idh/MocA family oxidoreductase [Acidobacteriota bacterium]